LINWFARFTKLFSWFPNNGSYSPYCGLVAKKIKR
jgi:hypothetical protein